ncbi:synaptonemal complex protein 1-like [Molothrus ater]|uniref:synaptonemal complex protein 1-like n=1 Tax=Molothrus ater TaxID=84834 RepID=UPI00174CCE6E|nr:synaptonemal complex protein 1-like [Molothrus ater]
MPQDTQTGKELSMESREDKSPQQNLVAEAVWSGSRAQESNGEEKPRRKKEQTAQEKNAVAAEVKKLQEQQEMNNLKKQVENKTKCIEELQQENKVLPKKLTAESK